MHFCKLGGENAKQFENSFINVEHANKKIEIRYGENVYVHGIFLPLKDVRTFTSIPSTDQEIINNPFGNTYGSAAATLNPFEIKDVPSINQSIIIDLTEYTHDSVRFRVGKESRNAIQLDVIDVREESKIILFKILDAVIDCNEDDTKPTQYYVKMSYAMIASAIDFDSTALIESNCESVSNSYYFECVTKLCSSRLSNYSLSAAETSNTADQVENTPFELVGVSVAEEQVKITMFNILVKLIFISNFGSNNNDTYGTVIILKHVSHVDENSSSVQVFFEDTTSLSRSSEKQTVHNMLRQVEDFLIACDSKETAIDIFDNINKAIQFDTEKKSGIVPFEFLCAVKDYNGAYIELC